MRFRWVLLAQILLIGYHPEMVCLTNLGFNLYMCNGVTRKRLIFLVRWIL